LTQEDAEKLAAKLNVKLDGEKDSWSIAEIFNKQTHDFDTSTSNRKVGFI
jgi:hypothetical protein